MRRSLPASRHCAELKNGRQRTFRLQVYCRTPISELETQYGGGICNQKSLFKVCHRLVKKRYAQNDPGNSRHADLIALFIFNFWNAIGLLPMTQAVVILGPDI